jgi:hypothetical protein
MWKSLALSESDLYSKGVFSLGTERGEACLPAFRNALSEANRRHLREPRPRSSLSVLRNNERSSVFLVAYVQIVEL